MKQHIIETLREAKERGSWVKLMFIYPNSKPIFNQGKVLQIFDDSFVFQDRFTGKMEFGFTYLERVEVVENEA